MDVNFMTPYQVQQLHSGDEVYWTDPDDGICSRHYIISEITYYPEDETVSIVDKDGSTLVAFPEELS